ncbi:hypothetical protein K1T71_003281 [Dendrolimus kikuchii]|uniref:Uncharacterized protein n=1 Tax=Dendrolimus kikuchii TaxID=765133 RepID=A0ACC1DBC8_9NEOP|nr:hypothetical protein K1T71_003281 [Dendrolimus kikuchii]
MIIFLTELQKKHLSLLHQHSTQVLIDFCKLVLDYLINGKNDKKNTIAAGKLGISISDVQNLVHALVYLLVEGSKHNLSESDFKSSLALAGFTNEQQEVLVKLYNNKRVELADALFILQKREPSYQDLNWRFEVQIASRSNKEEIKPIVTMDFVTMSPKISNNSESAHNINYDITEARYHKTKVINNNINNATAACQCQNVINHVLLQCDIPNLINLRNKLEQALFESKTQHVRKVQRAL